MIQNVINRARKAILARTHYELSCAEPDVAVCLLHILPKSVLRVSKSHGSSKDIIHTEAVLSESNLKSNRIYVGRGIDGSMALFRYFFSKKHKGIYTHFIYNIPGSNLSSILVIRLFAIRAKVYFRSHNAEYLHRLETAHVSQGYARFRNKILAIKRVISDYFIGKVVSNVIAISRSDITDYWSHLTGNCYYFPYITQSDMTPAGHTYGACSGLTKIVSLGTVIQKGEIALRQEINFYDYVRALEDEVASHYLFIQSAAQKPELAPSRVKCLFPVESLSSLLADASAVVLSASEGRGTKTKLVDAVVQGLPVIAPYSLLRKLDVEYLQSVIPFKDHSIESFTAAILTLRNFDYGASAHNGRLIQQMMRLQVADFAQTAIVSFQKSSNAIAILSVAYIDHIDYIRHFCYMAKRNTSLELRLFFICNNTIEQFREIELQFGSMFIPENLTIELTLGFAPPYSAQEKTEYSERIGSYRHAAALHFGLSLINFRDFSQILIIDPDFIVLTENGLCDLSRRLASFPQLDAINTIWNPALETHNLSDVCPHFFLFKSERFAKSQLDFTPELDVISKNSPLSKWVIGESRKRKTLFGQAVFNALYMMTIRGTSRDTGFRVICLSKKANIERLTFVGNQTFVKYVKNLQKMKLEWLLWFAPRRRQYFYNGLRCSHIGNRYLNEGELHVLKTQFGNIVSLHTRSKFYKDEQLTNIGNWVAKRWSKDEKLANNGNWVAKRWRSIWS